MLIETEGKSVLINTKYIYSLHMIQNMSDECEGAIKAKYPNEGDFEEITIIKLSKDNCYKDVVEPITYVFHEAKKRIYLTPSKCLSAVYSYIKQKEVDEENIITYKDLRKVVENSSEFNSLYMDWIKSLREAEVEYYNKGLITKEEFMDKIKLLSDDVE